MSCFGKTSLEDSNLLSLRSNRTGNISNFMMVAIISGNASLTLAPVMQEERRVDSQKTASWLREKMELQKQTNALKEELYQAETKNKEELERLRREKQELEAKTAGVDLKQIEKEEELVRSVKAEMERVLDKAGPGAQNPVLR